MISRFFIVLIAFVLIVSGIGFYKYKSVQKAMAEGVFIPPPTTVTSIVVQEENWEPVLSAVGSLEPVNGVKVSTDLGGIVSKIGFESGRPVNFGALLIQLDTTQEEATLRSAQSRNDLAMINAGRFKELLAKNSASKSDYDSAVAEARQASAAVDEQKALIARKTIRAPFAGLAGIRKVNVGQYVNPGDPLVEVASLDMLYVNFSLPQQYVSSLGEGRVVRVKVEGVNDQVFEGKITALNSMVDETTRNIETQATLQNPEGKLRPGMFAKVDVVMPETEKVVSVPSSSISYAPYGDSVFIIGEGKGPDGKSKKTVRQQVVKLGPSRGDQVAVLTGVKAGEEIVTSGVFKLAPGGEVVVNNEIQPGNNPAPNPADS